MGERPEASHYPIRWILELGKFLLIFDLIAGLDMVILD